MTDMREAVARAIANATVSGPFGLETDPSDYYEEADAALSLMQPEIDRRVAEEKAKAADALATLSARVETLEAALRFYARESSWKSCGVYMSGQSQPSSAIIDKGNRARQALGGDNG